MLVGLALASACGPDDAEPGSAPPRCAEPPPADCSPLVVGPDLYDKLFERVFTPGCSSGTGAACHASAGAKGGLVFDDADSAYAALLADSQAGRPRVVPGDPGCSELMVRLASAGHAYSMPPGNALSAEQLCSIRSWIADGAPR